MTFFQNQGRIVSTFCDFERNIQLDDVMYIDAFLWLPDILEKVIIKHNVTPEEAEEIFFSQPRFRFVESGFRPGEDVYCACGQTDSGRYLIVFFIHKPDNSALILSARDMTKKERKRYERK